MNLAVDRQLAVVNPGHSGDATRVGHEDRRERAQVSEPHRAVPGRHSPVSESPLQQLHGDSRQHRRGWPDDVVSVEESDVRHRAFGDEAVWPGQQRVVEAVPLCQPPVVDLAEVTEVLDVRDAALIRNGFQAELSAQAAWRPDDHQHARGLVRIWTLHVDPDGRVSAGTERVADVGADRGDIQARAEQLSGCLAEPGQVQVKPAHLAAPHLHRGEMPVAVQRQRLQLISAGVAPLSSSLSAAKCGIALRQPDAGAGPQKRSAPRLRRDARQARAARFQAYA